MTFLITGGAGFIGSSIAEFLLSKGLKVKIFDNLSTGSFKNISDFSANIEFIEGDIRDYQLILSAMSNVDVVLHQAALPSVPRSIFDPITSNEVNITGTLNVLNAAKEKKVKRVVFASSSSVYGDDQKSKKTETNFPNPLSPYAVTKLTGEQYCKVFNLLFGLETVVLRYFNVFGPKQDPNSQYSAVIPKFISSILLNKNPSVFGDGLQSRDFTFIENVVNANYLAATIDYKNFNCYNVACGNTITINKIIELINKGLDKSVAADYSLKRAGDIFYSCADISKITADLGYKVTCQFEEGLIRTIKWFEKNNGIINT